MTESRPAPDCVKLAVEDVPSAGRAVLAVLRHVSFAVGENEALVTQNCVACHAGYRLH